VEMTRVVHVEDVENVTQAVCKVVQSVVYVVLVMKNVQDIVLVTIAKMKIV
jgi:hypothetical protein